MFRERRKEKPHLFAQKLASELRDMMRREVGHEAEWAAYAAGDRISGLNGKK